MLKGIIHAVLFLVKNATAVKSLLWHISRQNVNIILLNLGAGMVFLLYTLVYYVLNGILTEGRIVL
ncbi:hypothetical protein PBOR_08795 [Paenibacillus borealis]|uniref:Uncharacterized protein n=1 Tax=Paenibacillus borealis TaxID=160799 RepID=A0A089LA96_PAEBO|nr:hypothetical protein PBOR_08795 [Paenibacillus borealis]